VESILTTIKKMLGIEEEYTHFDADVIMHINGVLMALNQMGIGSENGLFIESAASVWSDLLGTRKDMEGVKTYIFLKVRLAFDPPSSSYVLEAVKEQIKEHEWRLIHQAEKGATTV
jgi:hypothetical protein